MEDETRTKGGDRMQRGRLESCGGVSRIGSKRWKSKDESVILSKGPGNQELNRLTPGCPVENPAILQNHDAHNTYWVSGNYPVLAKRVTRRGIERNP